MQSKFYISVLGIATLFAQGGIAAAQSINSPGTAGTVTTPYSGQSGVTAPSATSSPSVTTGSGSGVSAPPSSLPSSATSLPGSNPSAPGFPGRVGR
jgi:hypothetical protein